MAGARLRGDRIVRLWRVALAWLVIVIGIVALNAVFPPRDGWRVFLASFEQLLFLAALVAAPIVVLSRSRVGYVLVGLLVVTALVRYGPQWISFPPAGEPNLTVTSWNVEYGENGPDRVLAGLAGVQSDLVGMVEFQPAMEQAVKADPTLSSSYPYEVFDAHDGSTGVALLSRFPIVQQQTSNLPAYIRAVVQPTSRATPLVVYVVHPSAPDIVRTGLLPDFSTAQRTHDQAAVRALVDADLAAGQTVVLMGDFNTTERDQAYADFSAGLKDTHLEAGIGPGLTWRPDELKWLPFGLIRIDYVLNTPDLVALTSSVRCTDLSDHCILSAALR